MERQSGAGAPHPLHIQALGRLDIRYEGQSLNSILLLKGQALLIYVALAARPVPRATLAGLLWSDMPDESARSNLRLTLSRLRRHLPPGILKASRQTIAFNRDHPHAVDALDLQLVASRPDAASEQRLDRLLQAVRGEFLQDFEVPDAPEFEHWILHRRQQFRQLILDAYSHLLQAARQRGDFTHGIHLARRLLDLEPWYEEGHRQLMWMLAHSGQRSAALAQFEQCRRLLLMELDVEPGSDTVALYEQIKVDRLQAPPLPQSGSGPGLPKDSTSAASVYSPQMAGAPQPMSTLPPQRTPFVGRVQELSLLQDRLLDPDYRLITILGEGGVGKTRLALALAWRLQRQSPAAFPDGIFYTSLAELPIGERGLQPGADENALTARLLAAVGAALALSFPPSQEPQSQIIRYLGHKSCLLIIDNFESLHGFEASVSFLLALLDHAPNVTLLLTSRLPLNVQAEYVFRLQGLAVPQERVPARSADYDSLLLFLERAERTLGRPLPPDWRLADIAQICRAVDGLPLGIELAASWLRQRTPQEIALALTAEQGVEAAELVAHGMHDLPLRHRSLRLVFEQSWRLLSPAGRQLLAQLSVFQGPFSAGAALAVTQSSDTELAALVDSSLVQRSLEGYYELHALVRRFAAEILGARPSESAALRQRHTATYMDFMGQLAAELTGPQPRGGHLRLQAEISNVLAAWQDAANTPYPTYLARGLPGMIEYWNMAGLFGEAERALTHALRRLQSVTPAPDSALLARFHVELSFMLFELGHYERAEQEARNAMAVSARPPAALLAAAGLALGRAAWGQGRFDVARAQFEQAYHALRGASDAVTEAVLLRNLAAVLWRSGDLSQARVYCQQALGLNRQLRHVRNESRDLLLLGIIADNEQRYDEAHALFDQVLHLAHQTGDRRLTASAYAEIGVTAIHQGRLDRTLHYLQQNLTMVRESGSLWHEGVTLSNLGDLKLKLGDFAGAEDCYTMALDMARQAGAAALESNVLAFWSLLDNYRGQYQDGAGRARNALEIAQGMNAPREIAFALQFLAHNLLALGRNDEARQRYQEAHEAWQALQHPARTIEALAGLAHAAHAAGDMAAYAQASLICDRLQIEHLEGADDPSRVYLTCYHIFDAHDDPRATAVALTGASRLQARVARLADAATRRAFLESVPSNAALRRLASSLA